jgi:DNA polymerase-3 subunit chi
MPSRVTFYDMPFAKRLALVARWASSAWERNRVMVITTDGPEMTAEVDAHLWTFEPDAFIPHEVWRGREGVTDPAARILIAEAGHASPDLPGRDVLVQLAPAPFELATQFDFVVDVVAREDERAIEASRERYRAWRRAGITPGLERTPDGA